MGEEQSVGWRLVGSNHRELGRSAESFAGFPECRAAVLRLRERIGDAKILLTTTEAAGGWSWRLEIDGQAAAVAGRLYQRQRDCQFNFGQFLKAVPVAELTEPTPPWPRGAGGRRPHGSGPSAGSVQVPGPGPTRLGFPSRTGAGAEPDAARHSRSGDDGDANGARARAGTGSR
ncbi:hypothetical protein ACGFNV_15440 [Streptomyces sp. NPDC048751]|uniref:hypothetical protein n=1 Tax=Streptomyces sp. NPDC048751 TaxID=3365591 RepID=UPI00371C1E63